MGVRSHQGRPTPGISDGPRQALVGPCVLIDYTIGEVHQVNQERREDRRVQLQVVGLYTGATQYLLTGVSFVAVMLLGATSTRGLSKHIEAS